MAAAQSRTTRDPRQSAREGDAAALAARSHRCCSAHAHAAAVAVREGRVGPEAVELGREPLYAPAACQALAACSSAAGGEDVRLSR